MLVWGNQKPVARQCLARRYRSRRGFTIVDLLVSIFVIAVLIGLLIPSLAMVNETARRVVCQSNVRQIGLGVVMFADDSKGDLPPSTFLAPSGGPRGGPPAPPQPQSMMMVRIASPAGDGSAIWDGLGYLYSQDYIAAPKTFYCPSHRGDSPFSRFAPYWGDGSDEIASNYHYRGAGPIGHGTPTQPAKTTRSLYRIDPSQSSLIADAMRIKSDYNHKVGVNFFRADLTVHWYSDNGNFSASLPATKDDADNTRTYVDEAWAAFDRSTLSGGPH